MAGVCDPGSRLIEAGRKEATEIKTADRTVLPSMGAGHAELAWLRNASETTVLSATALSKTVSLFGVRSFACDHCDPLGGK